MSIEDKLRPYIREAARGLACGLLRGLCGIRFGNLEEGADESEALAWVIEQHFDAPKARHPTWQAHRVGHDYPCFAAKCLLPPTISVDSAGCGASWSSIPPKYQKIGALRWYRWALRCCREADHLLKGANNGASLQQ